MFLHSIMSAEISDRNMASICVWEYCGVQD